MRKRSTKGLLMGVLVAAGVLAMVLVFGPAFFSPGQQAEDAVEEFYQYEQKGEFAKSWALFHSSMKAKFQKGAYIQDRAHVFMNHFGVETFVFKIGKPEILKKWQMAKTSPVLKDVYLVPVTQTYKGKYGNFDLKQDVFVVQEKGEWRILWDYNQ